MTFISEIKKKSSNNKNYWAYSRLPRTDIIEKEDRIELELELPGLDKEDIEISYKNGELTIQGEKSAEKHIKSGDNQESKLEKISFYRSFTIEDTIEEDKVKAKLEHGVLTITLLLKVPSKKEIPIL